MIRHELPIHAFDRDISAEIFYISFANITDKKCSKRISLLESFAMNLIIDEKRCCCCLLLTFCAFLFVLLPKDCLLRVILSNIGLCRKGENPNFSSLETYETKVLWLMFATIFFAVQSSDPSIISSFQFCWRLMHLLLCETKKSSKAKGRRSVRFVFES